MLEFVIRRVLWAIPTLFLVTLVSFLIIQLPPGDFVTAYSAKLAQTGERMSEEEMQAMRERYALDKPFYVQYARWMKGILLEGDFGQSLEFNQPVSSLIWERIGLTVVISSVTLLFIWLFAIPIGVYSATHQYSPGDYVLTFIGFTGRAIPDFLLALVLLWIGFAYLKTDVSGLFSPEFRSAPWSLAKIWDMMGHLWIPVIVLGTAGTAGLIRTMRANTLDELHKPYVETARAKGLSERKLVWKYPVRIALNPFISSVGYVLPQLISGSIIVAVVLNLPTTGPLFLNALLAQDMFLAGSFVLLLSAFTVIGTLISDILLAWVDPRIRYQ